MRNPLRSMVKAATRLRRFPVIARRRGAVFVLDPRNWIDRRLLSGDAYENAQLAHAMALIQDRNIDLFLDIGANFGLYSILLGRLAEIKQVIAFEPVARNFAQLNANIFANRLESKVRAMRLGLSNRVGQARIHIDPTSTGVSRLDLASAARNVSAFRANENVELARLDDIISLRGCKAFVKIDVEGEAAAVIGGMTEFLKSNICALQVEITTAREGEARNALATLGYRETRQLENDVIFLHPEFIEQRASVSHS